jgi:hypothetical protein
MRHTREEEAGRGIHNRQRIAPAAITKAELPLVVDGPHGIALHGDAAIPRDSQRERAPSVSDANQPLVMQQGRDGTRRRPDDRGILLREHLSQLARAPRRMRAPTGREQLALLHRRLMRTRSRAVAQIGHADRAQLPKTRYPLVAGFLADAILLTERDKRAATPQCFGNELETGRHDVGYTPWHSHLLLRLNVIPTSPLYPVYSSPINPVHTNPLRLRLSTRLRVRQELESVSNQRQEYTCTA